MKKECVCQIDLPAKRDVEKINSICIIVVVAWFTHVLIAILHDLSGSLVKF
jgi:hypothetical protein